MRRIFLRSYDTVNKRGYEGEQNFLTAWAIVTSMPHQILGIGQQGSDDYILGEVALKFWQCKGFACCCCLFFKRYFVFFVGLMPNSIKLP